MIAKDPTLRADLERWSSRRRAGTRSRRCAGPARACASWRRRCGAGPSGQPPWLADVLHAAGYSLQGNRKTRRAAATPTGTPSSPTSTRQGPPLWRRQPVISVDTKKKELVGDFKNGGREWQPQGDPEEVRVHDFVIPELGRAVPYGVYDLAANAGWVSVGIDHDTAAFAVASIRRWWLSAGRARYPDARRLLITADGGGSNGVARAPVEVGAAAAGRRDRADHQRLPPPARHQQVEQDRAPPLLLHQPELARQAAGQLRRHPHLIAATTTTTGLTVESYLDTDPYPAGSRSPTPRWPRSTSSATPSTATGTTPSLRLSPKWRVYFLTDP